MNTLELKWGTVKGWYFENKTDAGFGLLREYMRGASASCMNDRPDEARIKLLCNLIDEFDGTIFNDWDGHEMNKEEAKKYITEYGKKGGG
jgi:hypothetical protein